MAISAEVTAWLEDLKKEGSLDDAAFNALKATFENEKVGNFVKGSVLRQADYSRQSGVIQKAQQDLEAAQLALKTREDAVTGFQTELGTWQKGAQENFDKALKARENAERIAQTALARLKTLAAANGLSEEDVLKDIEVAPVVEKKVESTMDTSQFIKKEDLHQAAMQSVLGDASIYDIAAEFQELTGKPLKGAKELVIEAAKAGKRLDEFAAEKFGFAKLRADQSKAAIDKQIADGIAAGVTAKLSEAGIPGNLAPGRSDLRGSPVLSQGGIKMPAPGQQPGGGVQAAVAAFNANKYGPKQ